MRSGSEAAAVSASTALAVTARVQAMASVINRDKSFFMRIPPFQFGYMYRKNGVQGTAKMPGILAGKAFGDYLMTLK